jgi:hypothetical protein
LPDDQGKTAALRGVGSLWAQTDPSEAAAFAQTLPEGQGTTDFLRQIASGWALTDPTKAANWIQNLSPPQVKDVVAYALVFAWARGRSATEAASYVVGLPAGELQDKTAAEVVSAWAATDVHAAADWVRLFPEGNLRDKCMSDVIQSWAGGDPAAVAAWMDSVQKPRPCDLEGVANAWLSVDVPAAREWIAKSGLSDDAKRRLLNSDRH